MANSLLDFVMSLVRDPEAASRYAADPAGTLAAAQLDGVTSADVDNLIPVVSESLSVNPSTSGWEGFGAAPAGNVWASGAAAGAFEAFGAFDEQLPDPLGAPLAERIGVDAFDMEPDVPARTGLDDVDVAVYSPEPLVDEVASADPGVLDDVLPTRGADDLPDYTDQASSFDVFD
ncbi:Rv0340 family IniB-related protein [Mycobacterium sp. SMC-4]|uniref:Rv0340 family IniB-related protein n=1 Tax=Mycobacterium sp. SMC-4 TaxID=2857059 RepID=UPI003D085742